MNRKHGILVALVGICLLTATVASASQIEFRLLVNGADVESYGGGAGTLELQVQARVSENTLFSDGTNNYIGGVTGFGVSILDDTGIEAGSVFAPVQGEKPIYLGGGPDGKWLSTVPAAFTTHNKGTANQTPAGGAFGGQNVDILAESGSISAADLGAQGLVFGGGIIPVAEPAVGAWATLVTGSIEYNGGTGILSLAAPADWQQVANATGGVSFPDATIGDTVSFGAVANETPTVAIPSGDVLEGDWSREAGYNNPAHSVQVTAVGEDADGDPLTYEWTMTNAGGQSKVLAETGASLTLTIAEIESLGLPAWVGPGDPSYDWTLSVTANDGTATSDPAQIGVFIPEPTTMGLLGFGVLALLRRRRS